MPLGKLDLLNVSCLSLLHLKAFVQICQTVDNVWLYSALVNDSLFPLWSLTPASCQQLLDLSYPTSLTPFLHKGVTLTISQSCALLQFSEFWKVLANGPSIFVATFFKAHGFRPCGHGDLSAFHPVSSSYTLVSFVLGFLKVAPICYLWDISSILSWWRLMQNVSLTYEPFLCFLFIFRQSRSPKSTPITIFLFIWAYKFLFVFKLHVHLQNQCFLLFFWWWILKTSQSPMFHQPLPLCSPALQLTLSFLYINCRSCIFLMEFLFIIGINSCYVLWPSSLNIPNCSSNDILLDYSSSPPWTTLPSCHCNCPYLSGRKDLWHCSVHLQAVCGILIRRGRYFPGDL